MYCEDCKRFVTGKFCSSCGKKDSELINLKHCSNCGEIVPVTGAYCTSCGSSQEKRKAMSFSEYKSLTNNKRTGNASVNKKQAQKTNNSDKRYKTETTIVIKEMICKNGVLNPRGGFSIPLQVKTDDDAYKVKKAGNEKMSRYCPDFCYNFSDVKLVYKSGEVVRYIPGTDIPFTVQRYKEDSGLSYGRIVLYLQQYEADGEDLEEFLPPTRYIIKTT